LSEENGELELLGGVVTEVFFSPSCGLGAIVPLDWLRGPPSPVPLPPDDGKAL